MRQWLGSSVSAMLFRFPDRAKLQLKSPAGCWVALCFGSCSHNMFIASFTIQRDSAYLIQQYEPVISQGGIEDKTSICPSIWAFALLWNVAAPIKQMAFSQQALNLMNGLVLGQISFDQVHHNQKSISWRTIKCWSPVRLPIAHCPLLPSILPHLLGKKLLWAGSSVVLEPVP